jgi:hypothetical protein
MKIKKFNEEWDPLMDNPLDEPRKEPVIRFVESKDGDWIGMYVDGKLKSQNHTLSAKDAVFALGYTYKTITLDELETIGECPTTYQEAIEIKKKRKNNNRSELDPYGEEIW